MVLAAPTIRQLAALVDTRGHVDSLAGEADYGEVPPLPVVSWMYESEVYRRLSLSVLVRLPEGIDRPGIEQMLQLLLDGFAMLRSTLVDTPDGARVVTREPGVVRGESVLSRVELPTGESAHAAITNAARQAFDSL